MDRRNFLRVLIGFISVLFLRLKRKNIIPEVMLRTNKKLLG